MSSLSSAASALRPDTTAKQSVVEGKKTASEKLLEEAVNQLADAISEDDCIRALEFIQGAVLNNIDQLAEALRHMSVNLPAMVAFMLRRHDVYRLSIAVDNENLKKAVDKANAEAPAGTPLRLHQDRVPLDFNECIAIICAWAVSRSGNMTKKQEKKTDKIQVQKLREAMDATGVSTHPAAELAAHEPNMTRVAAAFVSQIGSIHKSTKGKYVKLITKEPTIAASAWAYFPGAVALYPDTLSESYFKAYTRAQVLYALGIRKEGEKRRKMEEAERQEYIASAMKYARLVFDNSGHVTPASKTRFVAGLSAPIVTGVGILEKWGFTAEDFEAVGFNTPFATWA